MEGCGCGGQSLSLQVVEESNHPSQGLQGPRLQTCSHRQSRRSPQSQRACEDLSPPGPGGKTPSTAMGRLCSDQEQLHGVEEAVSQDHAGPVWQQASQTSRRMRCLVKTKEPILSARPWVDSMVWSSAQFLRQLSWDGLQCKRCPWQ